jgi:hypothetical protein
MAQEDLSVPGYTHHEILRMGRDFGDSDFKVVIDGWVDNDNPDAIHELRFWWVNGDQDDERSPFGSKLRKHIGLEFVENAQDDWTVKLQGNRKEFVFDVELDGEGHATAFADIHTADGVISHCRAVRGEFVARRLLGIPIGIKELVVDCVDAVGHEHTGVLPFRKLKHGSMYRGD